MNKKKFCGKSKPIKIFQWQNNNGNSELGAAPPTTEPGVRRKYLLSDLNFNTILLRLDLKSSILWFPDVQVDMLSMLHGATPSYENLGGMFPGQYQ